MGIVIAAEADDGTAVLIGSIDKDAYVLIGSVDNHTGVFIGSVDNVFIGSLDNGSLGKPSSSFCPRYLQNGLESLSSPRPYQLREHILIMLNRLSPIFPFSFHMLALNSRKTHNMVSHVNLWFRKLFMYSGLV